MLRVFVVATVLGAMSGPATNAGKPPWLWTLDERIAGCVDDAARHARFLRELPSVRDAAPGWSPINGAVEPELFLPHELLGEFVRSTNIGTPHGVHVRPNYRPAIERAGGDYDPFWTAIDSAASDYLSLMKTSAEAQRAAHGHANLSQLQEQICRAQAKMSQLLHDKLGTIALDQFLYTNVAPSLHLWVRDASDTAQTLRQREGGCQ